MIKDITTTSAAFDLSKVEVGHLIIVLDSQKQLVGSGVILSVSPWQLVCGLYTGEQRWDENSLEGMDAWRVTIEAITSGEFHLIVIDPTKMIQ